MNESHCARLDDYLAGDLGGLELRAFDEHLSHCAACAEEVRLQAAIDRVLADASPQAPLELQRRVAVSIRRRRVRRFARATIAAAVLIACAVGGWQWLISDRRQPVESHMSQIDSPARAPSQSTAPPQIEDPPPPVNEPATVQVAVDAGNAAIVVARPSADPKVHIFWLYPTVSVSMNAAGESTNPSEPERNPL
jgi:hypothetical protein